MQTIFLVERAYQIFIYPFLLTHYIPNPLPFLLLLLPLRAAAGISQPLPCNVLVAIYMTASVKLLDVSPSTGLLKIDEDPQRLPLRGAKKSLAAAAAATAGDLSMEVSVTIFLLCVTPVAPFLQNKHEPAVRVLLCRRRTVWCAKPTTCWGGCLPSSFLRAVVPLILQTLV